MAYETGLKPFVFDQEGLFARKSSSNILSDPRILEHLRIVAEEAQIEEADEDKISDQDEYEFERKDLSTKIAAYNKRNQFGAFRVVQNELNYEGAVRFYFEDGNQELTKAVRVSNKTKVSDLLPILLTKFNFTEDTSHYTLFVVHEVDEIALDDSDCPLTIAINALKIPRFVLRLKSKLPNSPEPSSSDKPSASQRQEAGSEENPKPSTTPAHAESPTSPVTKSVNYSQNGSLKDDSVNAAVNKHLPSHKEDRKKVNRTRSFYQIASMVRKKKHANKHESTELSTYRLAPGILKVFGDHVSPGSNYKSVRASTISTSKEIVKQALEKYGLEHANPNDFVLCDVVGHFKIDTNNKQKDFEEAQWVTEYVRVVNDNEKPLVVQSLWKPADGRMRRFELIKKIEMESSFFFINTADNINRDSFLSSPFDQTDSERSSIISGADVYHRKDGSLISDSTAGDNVHTTLSRISSNSSKEGNNLNTANAPKKQWIAPYTSPFLLLFKGCNVELDIMLHAIDKNTMTVGNSSGEKSPDKPDLCLYSSDVLPHHCSIHRKLTMDKTSGRTETNIDEINFSVFIDPEPGAAVFINGVNIQHSTLIKPGQILSIGSHYCFLFKNPSEVKDSELNLSWLDSLKQVTLKSNSDVRDKEVQTDIDLSSMNDRDASDAIDGLDQSTIHEIDSPGNPGPSDEDEAFKRSSISLSYAYEDEDDMLNAVIHCMDEQDSRFKLTPAYILTMMIEHSCAVFPELRARKLFLKISSALQGIAWEKTKEIGKKVPERKGDVVESLRIMVAELEPVVLWMSNALEMLHYLQCHLNRYLGPKTQTSSAMKESLASADEELLTVLEEVIMFTFQQTVYHLTKILYSTLPAILDTNPFQNEDEVDDEEETVTTPPGVAVIIEIFQRTLTLASSHNVHPQIIVQLFAYLFFFTNASLFNSLMERGAGGKFYRWTKGVQIRGNLDVLEDWASQSGLQEQFGDHLRKIVAAVALLSIPKARLMQLEWNTIRDNYPDLNASQVQQLLGEYQLGGKGRPRGWYPPPEEVEAALRTTDVLESFATHPPLLLPTSSFMMDLNKSPEDESFAVYLTEILNAYGTPYEPKLEEPPKTNVARTVSTVSSTSVTQRNGQKISVSIQPSHTSTPQRSHVTINGNIDDERSKRPDSSSPRSSTGSSTTLPVDQADRHSGSFDGDADISDNSTPQETPEVLKKSPSKSDEVSMQERQPTPLPVKKSSSLVERDIEIATDEKPNKSSEYDNEARKSSLLGNTKSIQITARRSASPNPIRRSENKQAKSDAAHDVDRKGTADGNAKSGNDVANQLPDYIGVVSNNNDEKVVGDVDFTSNGKIENDAEDVFIVELARGTKGLGLGLIDGLITPLALPGIFIRTIVPNSPAAKDGRIRLGDRILAVNGTSLVGADYPSAMDIIINAGNKLSLLLAKSDNETVDKVISSQC